MPKSKPGPSPVERRKTDHSLEEERQETDRSLAEGRVELEKETDQELVASRGVADATEKSRRDATRTADESSGANGRVDAAVDAERRSADQAMVRERRRSYLNERTLLAAERDATNRDLAWERNLYDFELRDLKETLAQAREAHDAVCETLISRDEFVAIVAHDLRSPVSAIGMSASALLEDMKGADPEALLLLDVIRRNAAGLGRMIDHLLDVERLARGQLTLELHVCDLGRLASDGVMLFQPLATRRDITLSTRVPAERLAVVCDADRISQVLSNLIGNAIKFTPNDGEITVVVEATDADVCVTVQDNGQGIPDEALASIFERFSQLRNRDRRGLGLGLYIARSIVAAHGSELRVASRVGAGSTFSFRLPKAVR
jgi:signal transduction histidine kinase